MTPPSPHRIAAPASATEPALAEPGLAEPALAEPAPSRTVTLILAALLGAVALNLHHAALWCAPLALAAAAWRARSWRVRPRTPGRAWQALIVIVLTIAALLDFHAGGTLGAFATLLVVMAALKLSETTQRRDWLIVLGAVVFLLLAACLDAQELWRLPFYGGELWLLCAALYALGAGPQPPPTTTLLSSAARSLAFSVPLAIVLFLFVPRLPGAFWAVPQRNEALTGLGNDMSPGSITHLTQSNDPALRARFEGALPPPEQRYWRGPVLDYFDGYSWHRQHLNEPGPTLQYLGAPYRSEITLEPNTHNFLVALDLPQGPPAGLPSFFTPEYELTTRFPLLRAVSYEVSSYPRHRNRGPLSALERLVDLQLPHRGDPRSRALAAQLRAAAPTDAAYVRAVLAYLHSGGYRYTLDPPPLGRDSVDELLFQTRAGFCEHYASAFAFLMRAGGVPARVVTGYLGGEWNPFGDYLLVRQSAAHAWTEVWLEGQGWVREDPTAMVAPGSLTQQLDGALPGGATGPRLVRAPLIYSTVQAWQAMNAWWQDRVVGFNFDHQLDLLDRLGLRSQQWHALAWLVGIGAGLWLLMIAWTQRPRRRLRRSDALTRAWLALERKLEGVAGVRPAHEGPVAYAERIGRQRPELGPAVRAFARRYARLRYGPRASVSELQQFRRAVRLWRPRLRPRAR